VPPSVVESDLEAERAPLGASAECEGEVCGSIDLERAPSDHVVAIDQQRLYRATSERTQRRHYTSV
jgi:hypothetical protein